MCIIELIIWLCDNNGYINWLLMGEIWYDDNFNYFCSKEEESSLKVYLIVILIVFLVIVIIGCMGFFCFKGKYKWVKKINVLWIDLLLWLRIRNGLF